MKGLLSLFLPLRCHGCGGWVKEGEEHSAALCTRCAIRLRALALPAPLCGRCDAPLGTGRGTDAGCAACREWAPSLERARSAVLLAAPADELVHALKYDGWRRAAEPMIEAMARRWAVSGRPVDFLVPVPTTVARVRRRGYNQAALLAEGVAERLGSAVREPLERSGGRRSQIALHPLHRRANVRGAFGVRPGLDPEVAGARILIVDDVLTTGSTGVEVANVLAAAGAAAVSLLTFARALPERRPG